MVFEAFTLQFTVPTCNITEFFQLKKLWCLKRRVIAHAFSGFQGLLSALVLTCNHGAMHWKMYICISIRLINTWIKLLQLLEEGRLCIWLDACMNILYLSLFFLLMSLLSHPWRLYPPEQQALHLHHQQQEPRAARTRAWLSTSFARSVSCIRFKYTPTFQVQFVGEHLSVLSCQESARTSKTFAENTASNLSRQGFIV